MERSLLLGTVFKRFKTKAELFRAAMGDRLDEPDWTRNLAARVGQGDLREQLFVIGMEILAFFRELVGIARVVAAEQHEPQAAVA